MLLRIHQVIDVQVLMNSVVKEAVKNFGKGVKNRDWPVLIKAVTRTFIFINGSDGGGFHFRSNSVVYDDKVNKVGKNMLVGIIGFFDKLAVDFIHAWIRVVLNRPDNVFNFFGIAWCKEHVMVDVRMSAVK